uniref:Uncharacterized protein n=1 Tax=viral metagenome TaxID=1070528 RepID=A0A6C0E7Q0_9ZZZZ
MSESIPKQIKLVKRTAKLYEPIGYEFSKFPYPPFFSDTFIVYPTEHVNVSDISNTNTHGVYRSEGESSTIIKQISFSQQGTYHIIVKRHNGREYEITELHEIIVK